MSRHSARGRSVNGVLILDKPAGISSSAAVQRVKKLFGAKKVGHTGSLDPLATGVLPMCLGEATKFSQFLLTADKQYTVQARLGVATDSGDSEGNVIATRSAVDVTEAQLRKSLDPFRGEIEQVPSMFSAIKCNGQPLYKLARQGLEVPREPRRITIFSMELSAFENPDFTLEIHCTKGTYIRTLIADIGENVGCGAHVIGLRRTRVGAFDEDSTVTMEQIESARESKKGDELLLPTSSAVDSWPAVLLSNSSAYLARHGQTVTVSQTPATGWVKLCEAGGNSQPKFFGVGEVLDDGRIAPRRIIP